MKNQDLSKSFFELADILEFKKERWESLAYRKAARTIYNLTEDIESIYEKEGILGLKKISGVGDGIAKKIIEYLKTGKINEIEKFKKDKNFKIYELIDIETLGPKKVKILHDKLGIKNISDLKKAIKNHEISKLQGFGELSEKKIFAAIEDSKSKRYQIEDVLPAAKKIKSKIKNLNYVIRVDIAGSIRRKKETVKDVDILASSKKPGKVVEYFVKMKNVEKVLTKGNTRAAVKLKEGFRCDLRVVDDSSYGAALLYLTGSKDFSVKLRQIAIKKGLKLNEYGIFDRKNNQKLAGKSENEMFEALGIKYVEPNNRE